VQEQEQVDLLGISVLLGLRQNRKAGQSCRDNITIKIMDNIKKQRRSKENCYDSAEKGSA